MKLEQQDLDADLLVQPTYFQAKFDSKINRQVSKIAEAESKYLIEYSSVGNLQVWLLISLALLVLSIPTYVLTFYTRRQKISVVEGGKFDDLTSVYYFEQGLQKAKEVLNNQPDINFFAVISVDIDYMKAINHSFSYDFGDRFIRAFASTLEGLFNSNGIITRVRRNDFVIFVSAQSEQDIIAKIQEIHRRLTNLAIDEHCPNATCSIGYSCCKVLSSSDISDLCIQLVGQASIALRYAKYCGGNRWAKYDSEHAKTYSYQEKHAQYDLELGSDSSPF